MPGRRLCSLILIVGLVVTSGLPTSAGEAAGQDRGSATSDTPTTVVVVRHAERANDHPDDPTLTVAGERRARALLDVVEAADVQAIYSTQYRRTRSTVEPLAQYLQIQMKVREIASGEAEAYAALLAEEILSTHAGESVVVVGHSNTVPQIVEALSGHAIGEITEEEYDHVFIVVVPQDGPVRLFRARYGAPDGR